MTESKRFPISCVVFALLSVVTCSMTSGMTSGMAAGMAGGVHAGSDAQEQLTKLPRVALFRMHGAVGPCSRDGDEWFSATDFANAVVKAENDGIKTMILDIHSGGGLVESEERIIKAILESSKRGTLFIAFINSDAGSAAALISLACKHIFVTPAAKLGAAVTVLSGPDGTVSKAKAMKDDPDLAAKYESFDAAIHQAAADQTGRSPLIAAAMRQLKAELWWSPSSGFTATKQPDSTEQLDTSDRVLTLTAVQVARTGIGTEASSLQDVLRSLGMSGAVVDDQKSEMAKSPNKLKVLYKALRNLQTKVADSRAREGNAQGGTTPAMTASFQAQCNKKQDEITRFERTN